MVFEMAPIVPPMSKSDSNCADLLFVLTGAAGAAAGAAAGGAEAGAAAE